MTEIAREHCPDCGKAFDSDPSVRGLCPHCLLGLALVDPESEEISTRVRNEGVRGEGQILGNRYRFRSLLGRGGMGEVWRAFDLKLRVDVALKELREGAFGSSPVRNRPIFRNSSSLPASADACRSFSKGAGL